jgi:hypothetical protein
MNARPRRNVCTWRTTGGFSAGRRVRLLENSGRRSVRASTMAPPKVGYEFGPRPTKRPSDCGFIRARFGVPQRRPAISSFRRHRLGMGKGRLTSLVRLSWLSPAIVRALLEGRQPTDPDAALAIEQGTAPGLERTATIPRLRRRKVDKFRPERSITPDSKTASRDTAGLCAPNLGVWRLWLPLMRWSES